MHAPNEKSASPKEKENKSAEDHISKKDKDFQEKMVDEQIDESFPASDPPANY